MGGYSGDASDRYNRHGFFSNSLSLQRLHGLWPAPRQVLQHRQLHNFPQDRLRRGHLLHRLRQRHLRLLSVLRRRQLHQRLPRGGLHSLRRRPHLRPLHPLGLRMPPQRDPPVPHTIGRWDHGHRQLQDYTQHRRPTLQAKCNQHRYVRHLLREK